MISKSPFDLNRCIFTTLSGNKSAQLLQNKCVYFSFDFISLQDKCKSKILKFIRNGYINNCVVGEKIQTTYTFFLVLLIDIFNR